ncbi:polysaccharide deacetylase family protein [Rhizobium sp. 1399]|uniref:polysaccharide deacetylase family protein n=1 Tax=Rhizobium sp. 1399 TaxID=2817758 RepID=UPI00285D08F6|nr:polysaccharide deacetylase family protein [Rhizobium sp. 1399]MDR6665896.1 peptidoglycan/xylan/chitin deacetylase (PgdA/CDA1 family) [Rhizobium sp. 1399]
MEPRSYGPFAYSPIIRRARWKLPGNARVALWVIPNIEFFALDEQVPAAAGGGGVTPDIPTWSVRDYGNRIGIFRMMKVFDKFGIRGTVALNSDLCKQHPEILEEAAKRNWELMGHNESNTRRLNAVPPEEERGIINRAVTTIRAATGQQPVGWLGSGLQETWNTLEHLQAEGVRYVCDWTNDDQPYWMSLPNGRNILSVPYSQELNDKPAFEKKHMTSVEFGEMICRQFDVLWEEGAESGRVMAIALHPYITGVPHRIRALEEALAYVCKHEGVWRATGSEIAQAYAEAFPLSSTEAA